MENRFKEFVNRLLASQTEVEKAAIMAEYNVYYASLGGIAKPQLMNYLREESARIEEVLQQIKENKEAVIA